MEENPIDEFRPASKAASPLPSKQPPITLKNTNLSGVKENNKLWYILHVYIYDLRHFRSNTSSRARLDAIISPNYLGNPYFTADEAQTLHNTIVDEKTGSTLQDRLDEFFEKKLEERLRKRGKEEGEWKICAAHDLAPVFERGFRIDGRELGKNKAFVGLVKKGGLNALDDGVVWKGLGKR